MYLHKKGYYYAMLLENGKTRYVNLGRVYGEALIKYAHVVAPVSTSSSHTFGDLASRYVSLELPKKSERYCREQTRVSKFVLAGLGEISKDALTARMINQYLNYRETQSTPLQVQKERALIAGVCKMACKSGDMGSYPMHDVPSRCGISKSTRVVRPEEIAAFYEFCRGTVIADYLRFKVLTGLRKSDILTIHRNQIQYDGIHVTPGKTEKRTGKSIIIQWSPALRQVVNDLLSPNMFLFSTRKGGPYSYSGFNAIWQRKMRKAHEQGVLKERFKDSDLRSFVADSVGLAHAKELLAHATQATTETRYRRKPQKVDPSA